jgi:hypothetical protein
MAWIKNIKTGETEEVTEERLRQVATDPNFRAIVVSERGEVGTVPVSHLTTGGVLGAGMQLATGAQVEEQRTDPALVALGATPEGIRERQERNEVISTAGEAVGILGSVLATGGAAGAAQVGGRGVVAGAGRLGLGALRATPAALVARGGRVVEQGLAASTGGGLGARIAAGVTAGAGEGALWGAGHAVSEAAIQDHDLTAERLLAHVKTGSMLGGAAGGLFVGGKAALTSLAPKVAQWTPAALNKATKPEAIEDFISSTAFQAAKGPGAGKKFVERAKRVFGDQALPKVGRNLLDEGIVTQTSTLAEISQAAGMKAKEWGRKIGSVLKRLDDEAEISLRPSRKVLSEKLEKDVLAKLDGSKLPDLQRMGATVRRRLDPFLAEGQFARTVEADRIRFSDLHAMRAELDDLIFRTDRASPVIEELRSARAIIEGVTEKAAANASKRLGDDVASAYKNAKEKFASMKIGQEMAEDAASRLDTNRNFSLSDMLVTQAAGMGEIMATGDIDPSTLAMAFLAGRVHRMVRTRGAAFTAATLNQASTFVKTGTIQKVAETGAKRTKGAVSKFFNLADEARKRGRRLVAPAAVKLEEPEPLSAVYNRKAAEHREFIGNPSLLAHRTTEIIGGADQVTPRTSMAIGATAVRAASFLQQKMPTPKVRASDIFAHIDPLQRVPDSEMAKYLRYAKAVEDPMSVISDFADGTVTREAAEALREVYPRMFAELETQITEQITARKEPLPYDATLRLSILLDRALHPSLEPKFIARAQMVHRKAKERRPPSERRVPDMAENQATEAQRASV